MMISRADTIRNLVIIYGFSLVFLSAILSLASASVDRDPIIRFTIYMLAVAMAISSVLIGLSLLVDYKELNTLGWFGLLVMVSVVNAAFLVVVGRLLGLDDMLTPAFLVWIASIVGTGIVHFYRKSRSEHAAS